MDKFPILFIILNTYYMKKSNTLIFLIILFLSYYPIWCQTAQNQNWLIPKHQIQAYYGSCKNLTISEIPKLPSIGLSYTLNVSKHFYAQFQWQLMSGDFIMSDKLSTYTNNIQREVPSPSTPLELPYVSLSLKKDRNVQESEIRASNIIKLTSSDGYYNMNEFHINLGYMLNFNRHVFRMGLGLSYFQWNLRDIKYDIDLRSKEFGYNGMLIYDFFITHSLLIGLNYCILSDYDMLNRTSVVAFSVGFAPNFSRANKN
jgi:hypothetical protein